MDLNENRAVSKSEGEDLAKQNNLKFYETSAKEAFNIEEVFAASAEEIAKNIDSNRYDLKSEVSIYI